MQGGYAYLCAVIDWHSRCVLSWERSNTLDASFCVRALKRALAEHGTPDIFNTDQGCQFTSAEFTRGQPRGLSDENKSGDFAGEFLFEGVAEAGDLGLEAFEVKAGEDALS